ARMNRAGQPGGQASGARSFAAPQSEQTPQPTQPPAQTGTHLIEVAGDGEKSVNVAFNVDVVVDVGFAKRVAARRPEHFANGTGMLQDEREPGRVAYVRLPDRSIPGADGEVARAVSAQHFGQKSDTGSNGGIFGQRSSSHRHSTFTFSPRWS